ncbi:hypothetical protein O181_012153 [Austropuccinia psidii MF-1]|uniref:Uncharacterized protein n=1 Tax=Austropuccinia psidii MF-1 TaxID=1389203 RepID=A0A9Q3BWP0_9BASI|nr:hypothetical protein [Austropuccinia psidii MF-1]
MVTSQQLKSVSSTSRRKKDRSTLQFPATQVCQQREHWPIQVTREDQNMENEGQEHVTRLFGRVYRNDRVVISSANYRMIPATASEEMAAKFAWYEDELINELQRIFDYLNIDK